MKQLELPFMPANTPTTLRPVNVASVKHRSPFRYPGGKTWLVPHIFQWLTNLPPNRRAVLLEPFAGGAIVGLSAAFEELVQQTILVELDEQIAAVWDTIINQHEHEWLANQIENFDLTQVNVNELLAEQKAATREQALQTIVKNRVNRGGILAKGAGRIKNGENNKGLTSRWYPQTLSQRIQAIGLLRDSLSFIHGDGMQIIRQYLDHRDVVYFIDPPYTAAGKKPGNRLYNYSEIDHCELFQLAAQISGDFLMTYDNVDEIRQMAVQYNFDVEPIAMKNTHHAKLTELLIGKNLDWIRS